MESILKLSYLDPDQVVVYKLLIPQAENKNLKRVYIKVGIMHNGQYHEYYGFNKFSKKGGVAPLLVDGWVKQENDKAWIMKHVCDPNAVMFEADKYEVLDDKYVGFTKYYTLDNRDIGHIVFISPDSKIVYVYGRTNEILSSTEYSSKKYQISTFTRLVCRYEPEEIFIGKSCKNVMTKHSGAYGNIYDGNSILLRIGSDKYVHIGIEVYEFVTDEKIIKYVSSVGNNCVPYPYAESANWCYCMSECKKIPKALCMNRETDGDVFNCGCENTSREIQKIIINNRDSDNSRIPYKPHFVPDNVKKTVVKEESCALF